MNRRVRGWIGAWSALIALSAWPAAQAAELGVLRVTPSGDDVAASNQIVIHFDRAVVPLGRMDRTADEVPAQVTPDPGCQWRWLDAQALACNLPPPQMLQPATRYRVEIDANVTAIDGARLSGVRTHGFVTERPRLSYAFVQDWAGPGEPVLRARFNQPVTAATVEAALRLDDVPVRVEPVWEDAETPFFTPEGEARRGWRLRPASALRPDRAYRLRAQAGLRSAFGVEPGRATAERIRVDTFPALRALGVRCEGGAVSPALEGRECPPLEGVGLAFSAPVSPQALKAALRISPAPPQGSDPDFDPWAVYGDDDSSARPGGSHSRGRIYSVRLPFQFAAETEYRVELAAGLQDRFGRVLDAPLTMRFRTGARTPRLVFEHDHAVVESGLDSEVPAVVTNLDRIDARFDRLTAEGLRTGQSHAVTVAPVRNVAFPVPLEVRAMLGGATSGAVRGQLSPQPVAAGDERPRDFFAAVTPWQLHAKFGHSNLLVWATSMADGAPVRDAEVAVLESFGGAPRASARTDADGVATLPGAAELDPKLERAWGDAPGPLWLRVQRGADVAVMPLSSAFSVDTWRASQEQVSAWRRERHGHLKAWGTTAQGVYRAGDRVQYKVYVRDDAGRSLAPAPAGDYRLQVYDPVGTVVHEREGLKLSAFGSLHGEFALSARAAVGWYRFELTPAFATTLTLEPLRVLVSDFVPAPFRVQTELRVRQAQPGETIPLQLSARLHGGGAFADAPARLMARIQSASFEPRHPLAARFRYDTAVNGGRNSVELRRAEARLDAQGEWTQDLETGDGDVLYGRLIVDGSVQDDRGRSIAAQASVPYLGRDRYIGLRTLEWVAKAGRQTAAEVLVVSADGQPWTGVPYYVKIERMDRKGARVKGAGNAYITRYVREWVRVATCQGRSSDDAARCAFTPDRAGEYRLVAMVRDSRDRLHETQQWLYVQGADAVLWEDRPDTSLDIRTDKAEYRQGQIARLFVKNPYPGVRAWVTVERYGVLDQWMTTLKGNAPVIEIPIKPEYLPGAYVSVVAMSPRVEAPLREGVDLGKPTFRRGYTTLTVKDPQREIAVDVKPQRAQYRPGERVTVDLQARPRQASGEPVELAVAVLDEAVFDLIQSGTSYFDPLKGFTSLEPLDLANYSLLTRLVGRQKFEKKGANPGGDGGADLALRSVEQFVAYWNPALTTDADGRARIAFTLPDNLTGWRVLALAATPSDRMGLGQGTLAVSKPTELRPAMPNRVALNDRFDAGFTVLNRESSTRRIAVTLAVEGGAQARHEETVDLKPFERRTVFLPVTVTQQAPLTFSARAGDASDRDALNHVVAVVPQRWTQVAADYSRVEAGSRVEQTLRLPPTAERGDVRVGFSPTVLGNLDGAFAYLRDYPYGCWEQQLSTAVMAAHYRALKPWLGTAIEWPEAERLPETTLARAADFQAPGGGMAFWLPSDAQQSPYLSAFTALAFGWLRELGHEPPKGVSDKLNAYLRTLLKDEVPVRGYESAEARAQLRAVALAALARQGLLESDELQRYAPQISRMGLFGQSMYAQAAAGVGAAPLRTQALDAVLARAQFSAGRMALREDDDRVHAWMLGSELRSNCAALSGLLAQTPTAGVDAEWPTRLARAITQARGARTHWQNTQENLFCTRALVEYAQRYERAPLQLQARVSLDEQLLGSIALARGQTAAIARVLTATDVDRDQRLTVSTQGSGQAYVETRLRYIERADAQQPVSAGFGIERRYAVYRDGAWQPLADDALHLRRGERVKVTLDVAAPAWMTYVVVDDPVPGGLEPINPDLATASAEDAAAMDLGGGAHPYPFYHRELRFDAVRHYADWIDAGRYRLSWIGQAVATGEFAVGAPRVEQMYDPDVYATGRALRLRIEPAP